MKDYCHLLKNRRGIEKEAYLAFDFRVAFFFTSQRLQRHTALLEVTAIHGYRDAICCATPIEVERMQEASAIGRVKL